MSINPYYRPYWVSDDELEHYGVKGQQWGVQNGPPYPIEDSKLRLHELSKKDKKDLETVIANLGKSDFNNFSRIPKVLSHSIIRDKGKPVGFYVTYPDKNGAGISVAVDPSYRNRGIATSLMKKAITEIKNDESLQAIYCGIRKDNVASMNLAKKLGLTRDGMEGSYYNYTWYRMNSKT